MSTLNNGRTPPLSNSNGINLNNMLDVLHAGAAGIGFVGPLFDPKMIEDLNFGVLFTM